MWINNIRLHQPNFVKYMVNSAQPGKHSFFYLSDLYGKQSGCILEFLDGFKKYVYLHIYIQYIYIYTSYSPVTGMNLNLKHCFHIQQQPATAGFISASMFSISDHEFKFKKVCFLLL